MTLAAVLEEILECENTSGDAGNFPQADVYRRWRLTLMHLAAQSAMRVDEAMVERACVAGAKASTPNVEWSYYEPLAKERLLTFTSAALQAAIGGKE